MYYVLQVAPREEEKTEKHIMEILPDCLYGECFHPTRLMRKKFHGQWKNVREKLLPGYVFITTENAQELFLHLKEVPLLTKIVGRDMEYFIRMPEQEEQWLEKLMRRCSTEDTALTNGQEYELGLSQIDISEGNEIRVISGPLKDLEGMIKKINLHKRMAEVEVPFMGGCTVIHLGIELVERT